MNQENSSQQISFQENNFLSGKQFPHRINTSSKTHKNNEEEGHLAEWFKAVVLRSTEEILAGSNPAVSILE